MLMSREVNSSSELTMPIKGSVLVLVFTKDRNVPKHLHNRFHQVDLNLVQYHDSSWIFGRIIKMPNIL